MKKMNIRLLIFCLMLISEIALAGTSDVVVQNITVGDGEIAQYYGYNSLTAGPSFTAGSGSDVSLQSSGTVILAPGFIAETGSKLVVGISDVPPIEFDGSASLIKGGECITLTWDTGYDEPDTTLLPDIGVVNPSDSLNVCPSSTTTYTIRADRGSSILEETFTVTVDSEPPVVSNSYPPEDEQINLIEAQTGLSATFSDNTGIASISLFKIEGEAQTDLTSQADVGDNTLNFNLSNLEDGSHTMKVVATDMAGNETEKTFNFELDTTLPVTSPSVPAGSYSEPFTIDLNCSEEAVIFYSSNSIPYEGGPNTLSGTAPVTGIQISHGTNLQFFAKDTFGNIEAVKSAVYLLGKLPTAVTGVGAVYHDPNIDITWQEASEAASYRVYRALSPMDVDALEKSIQGGYPPPQNLRYSQTDIPFGTLFLQDSSLQTGMTYYYGVTQVNGEGLEGVIGELVSVSVPLDTGAQDIEEAKARAFAWLESNQDITGFWGSKPSIKMLATSQVLNAYKLVDKNDFNTYNALFYLKGNVADNSDFLSRKIVTLNSYNQNVDGYVSKLITRGYFTNDTELKGWGINQRYVPDPVTTALGVNAIAKNSSPLPLDHTDNIYIKNNVDSNLLEGDEADTFGWISEAEKSIFVSSLVYCASDSFYTATAPNFSYDWILTSQLTDGSFENSVADTAAAILWIDSLGPSEINDAKNYLVSQQNPNGSWQDDPYLTGLCLEALLK